MNNAILYYLPWWNLIEKMTVAQERLELLDNLISILSHVTYSKSVVLKQEELLYMERLLTALKRERSLIDGLPF